VGEHRQAEGGSSRGANSGDFGDGPPRQAAGEQLVEGAEAGFELRAWLGQWLAQCRVLAQPGEDVAMAPEGIRRGESYCR
jgi:hypothetical protein